MAAIISQMAANKRARQKRNVCEIHSDKCVYNIPPFDRTFDPFIHNKYLRSKKLMEDRISKNQVRIAIEEQLKLSPELINTKPCFEGSIKFNTIFLSISIGFLLAIIIYIGVMWKHAIDANTSHPSFF
nr:uncharacterized protein LOC121129552 [Lepeophtheirus salmonis]